MRQPPAGRISVSCRWCWSRCDKPVRAERTEPDDPGADCAAPREEELVARVLLADQAQIDVYWHQQRWAELAAQVRYVSRAALPALAQSDPALYRELRQQITRFFLRDGGVLSLIPAVGADVRRLHTGCRNRREEASCRL